MKKMTAFVMALALVCTNVPANLHVQTGTETVYANAIKPVVRSFVR